MKFEMIGEALLHLDAYRAAVRRLQRVLKSGVVDGPAVRRDRAVLLQGVGQRGGLLARRIHKGGQSAAHAGGSGGIVPYVGVVEPGVPGNFARVQTLAVTRIRAGFSNILLSAMDNELHVRAGGGAGNGGAVQNFARHPADGADILRGGLHLRPERQTVCHGGCCVMLAHDAADNVAFANHRAGVIAVLNGGGVVVAHDAAHLALGGDFAGVVAVADGAAAEGIAGDAAHIAESAGNHAGVIAGLN
ncbi:hypothetical protein GMD88_00200 [Pseudoflavonifractor sp. BIOML-A6]|nr:MULTISPECIES: hypothetical protein [unclassified Pseudoflavonifractor]MTQ97834.1 hypothetical protein [Pseudoflavonifractor sp. BIOML-A16]MTR04520.1 hypothetical protein [Pseudoflavonifractor sp. BIOML-A15]MTR33580.1 hypothetical protein [Pseudoflavonifractor sp. BIOML-A14]MTR71797.1 hypothetical protein [Pseudoflavonifractor sp. BIOML-A18]MTS62660.1 hypothetical protein [Pseudoflavonifractor sp. BIOML-A5]MTS71746.1 hypothetical protein [Pseudoflavonifractor sp. BIOML-A8]MTS89832.1 hypoth